MINIDLVWYGKINIVILLLQSLVHHYFQMQIIYLNDSSIYVSDFFLMTHGRLLLSLCPLSYDQLQAHIQICLYPINRIFFLSTKAILFLIHFISTLNLFYRMKRTLPWSTGDHIPAENLDSDWQTCQSMLFTEQRGKQSQKTSWVTKQAHLREMPSSNTPHKAPP